MPVWSRERCALDIRRGRRCRERRQVVSAHLRRRLKAGGLLDEFVGCVGDAQSLGKAAGTCMIGYPGAAARPDVPKMKWSP